MEHRAKLTSSEIEVLSVLYKKSTMQICIYNYFTQNMVDKKKY
jgi:hypothetical protein